MAAQRSFTAELEREARRYVHNLSTLPMQAAAIAALGFIGVITVAMRPSLIGFASDNDGLAFFALPLGLLVAAFAASVYSALYVLAGLLITVLRSAVAFFGTKNNHV